jgi:carotenoid cleavage dioxygenase
MPGENAGLVAAIKHGGQRLGGEAYFVPRPAATTKPGRGKGAPPAEDDGYLMTFVTDAATGKSELVVYDASSMSSVPVARLRIPHRVPLGFHCTWVTAAELAAQRNPDA